MSRLQILLFVLSGSVAACGPLVHRSDSGVRSVLPLFGPVISREVIGGHTDDGGDHVWVLAGGEAIVRIDLKVGVATRTAIALSKGERCWGLARLADGSVWTLLGQRTLAQVDSDGRIAREISLSEPHFGLYAHGDRLVYQPARFNQTGPLLFAGIPGDSRPTPWSAIEPRPFPTLARASAAALNMVACGRTRTAEQPCWFPDDTLLALIGPAGVTRRLALSGLTKVAPEVLLTSDNPARPLRDVFVDAAGAIWVLSSGTPAAEASDAPGGWLLAEYTRTGALVRISRLRESVRLILRADPQRLVVLTGAGMIAEVER